MLLTLIITGQKHQLEASDGAETVQHAKVRAEALCAIPAVHQKWVVKGKTALDGQTLTALGLQEGSKIMILRNAGGAASVQTAAPTSTPAPAVPDVPDNKEPLTAGEGDIALSVVYGKQRIQLRCESSSSVGELKQLLEPLTSAVPAQQRLYAA